MCGAPLLLKDFIAKEVEQSISVAVRDRDILETESAIKVFEKAWGWVKTVLAIAAVLVAIVGGGVIWKASDFWSGVSSAKRTVSEIADTTSKDLSNTSARAVSDIQEAAEKAIAANQTSSEKASRLSSDLAKDTERTRSQMAHDASSLRNEVAASQSQLEAVDKLQPQFDAMRSQLTKATSDLAAQQKVISNSENFVRQVFSTHKTVLFQLDPFIKSDSIVIPRSGNTGNSVVLMLLPESPLP